MFSSNEIGRLFGIPIYLDMFFVLILILFTYPYFTSGSTQLISAGFVIVVGIMLSILLHELGHALVGRALGAEVSHIELTGLGGIAHFTRSLPRSALIRILVYVAGPAMNLLLWLGLGELAANSVVLAKPALRLAIGVLATVNFWLMVFNMLPAYPLDGGHTLDALAGTVVGSIWSQRIVAALGLVISVLIGIWSFPGSIWMMFLAFILFMSNWQALQSVGGFGGRR